MEKELVAALNNIADATRGNAKANLLQADAMLALARATLTLAQVTAGEAVEDGPEGLSLSDPQP